MRAAWHLPILFIVLLAAPAIGQDRVDAQPSVAEPIVIGLDPSPAPDFADMVLIDRTARVLCDGAPVEPVYSEALPPTSVTGSSLVLMDRMPPAELIYAFAIQPDGRPRSIRQLDPIGAPVSGLMGPDIQSSLAAWRFPPVAREDCSLTLAFHRELYASASPGLLARELALSGGPNAPKLRAALARPGDNCRFVPRPEEAAFPHPATLAPPPGGRSWAALRYSIDNDGRPTAIETLDASSDQTAEAVRGSLAATRFSRDQPRRGCLHAVSRYGEPMKDVPPTPDALQSLNQCSPETLARMTLNKPHYPEAFRQRGIEGWAVVRFDLASWGEVGGIKIVAAEPAWGFGTAAERIFHGARVQPAFEHAANCARRVTFRLPLNGESPDAE